LSGPRSGNPPHSAPPEGKDILASADVAIGQRVQDEVLELDLSQLVSLMGSLQSPSEISFDGGTVIAMPNKAAAIQLNAV